MRGVGRVLPSLSAVGAYPQRVPPRGARALGTAETARLGPHDSMVAAPQHGGLGVGRAPGRLPSASRLACRVRPSASPRSASQPRHGARPAHVRCSSSRPREPRTAGAAGPTEGGERRDLFTRDPALRAVGRRSGIAPLWGRPSAPGSPVPGAGGAAPRPDPAALPSLAAAGRGPGALSQPLLAPPPLALRPRTRPRALRGGAEPPSRAGGHGWPRASR